MIFTKTSLWDAWRIDVERHTDSRGYFARTMCRSDFQLHGISSDFVQHNTSLSRKAGTLRGLHYQRHPFSEGKLVRCTRGSIWDVIVDLRADSESYLQHESFELSADNGCMLYVPQGFAHSFITLEDTTEVSYSVTAPYNAGAEGGIRYDDPQLGIRWPIPIRHISDKDASWPFLVESLPAFRRETASPRASSSRA